MKKYFILFCRELKTECQLLENLTSALWWCAETPDSTLLFYYSANRSLLINL